MNHQTYLFSSLNKSFLENRFVFYIWWWEWPRWPENNETLLQKPDLFTPDQLKQIHWRINDKSISLIDLLPSMWASL